MNPFTKSIARTVQSRQLRQFIQRWDVLEALVVRVYRAGAAADADETEYAALREWLGSHYPSLQAALQPHWRGALRGGQPSEDDPFVFLFAPERANGFAGSWTHLQALPAAREALNRLILESGQS